MAEITEKEVEVLDALGKIYNLLISLPVLHPGDLAENVRDIHDLQNRILSRVGLRAMRERDEGKK